MSGPGNHGTVRTRPTSWSVWPVALATVALAMIAAGCIPPTPPPDTTTTTSSTTTSTPPPDPATVPYDWTQLEPGTEMTAYRSNDPGGAGVWSIDNPMGNERLSDPEGAAVRFATALGSLNPTSGDRLTAYAGDVVIIDAAGNNLQLVVGPGAGSSAGTLAKFSPDGSKVAAAIMDASDNQRKVITVWDTSDYSEVVTYDEVTPDGRVGVPVWSPDSDVVAFSSGVQARAMSVLNAVQGATPVEIMAAPVWSGPPNDLWFCGPDAWSDVDRLVLRCLYLDNLSTLRVGVETMAPTGGIRRQLAEIGPFAAFSPASFSAQIDAVGAAAPQSGAVIYWNLATPDATSFQLFIADDSESPAPREFSTQTTQGSETSSDSIAARGVPRNWLFPIPGGPT